MRTPVLTLDPPIDQAVWAVVDTATDIVEVTVRGRWDRRLWVRVHRTLTRCLAQHPRGMIVDLSALDDPGGRSASSWSAACAMGSRMQPPVPIVLCLAPASPLAVRLRQVAGAERVRTVAALSQARATLLGQRTAGDRLLLSFAPEPVAPAAARAAVAEACHGWGLDSLLHPAQLVVAELMTNAVYHARTRIQLILSPRCAAQRVAGLHLAVCDRDPRPPVLREPTPGTSGTPLDRPGLGLHIVEAAAFAWGTVPTRDGKVVWALLREDCGPAGPSPREPVPGTCLHE
jgi:anti-sigma regulatory factor (Ser/Thr protein kinase)